ATLLHPMRWSHAGPTTSYSGRPDAATAWVRFRGTGVTEYLAGSRASLGLDVGRADHLAPLLGVLGDELTKIGRRARKRRAAQVGKPRLDLGVGEACIDLLVEVLDNLYGRVARRADAVPVACLVAGQELTHSREVRQRLRACRGRHRERAQPTGPDVPD